MKERLTGAIILVAALVLLVPELLTGPGRSAPVPPADSSGSSDLRSYVIDLAEDGAARTPATAAASVPVAAPEGATPGGTVPDPEGPEGLERSSMPQADAASGEASAPGAETRAVAGTVAEAEHASRPQGRNDAVASVSAGTTVASATSEARGAGDAASATSGGSRAEGNAARTQESGTARAAAPKDAAPAARPESRTASAGQPGSGWVVQVGSFSSRENAERLARELRGKGFASFVNESPGKGGKHYWRVRVGPERTREAANALRTKLRAAGHSGGSVMSYP